MLVRRSLAKGNNWAMFGGKFDKKLDKGPKDTAKREFSEESGFKGDYQITKDAFHIFEDNHISFYTFLGIFEEEFVPCGVDHAREHSDFGWFELNKMPENLHHELGNMMIMKHKELETEIRELRGK